MASEMLGVVGDSMSIIGPDTLFIVSFTWRGKDVRIGRRDEMIGVIGGI